jgi:hypothetical protein
MLATIEQQVLEPSHARQDVTNSAISDFETAIQIQRQHRAAGFININRVQKLIDDDGSDVVNGDVNNASHFDLEKFKCAEVNDSNTKSTKKNTSSCSAASSSSCFASLSRSSSSCAAFHIRNLMLEI